jgi:hypothetical protein
MIFCAMMLGAYAMVCRADVSINARVDFGELDNYGEWVMVPGYGTVWRPDADPDWRPFTYGHWVYSNEGWAWDSDEPFGWIVCHYGDWCYDDEQGWVWVPGYEWSPARVKWYVTDNEIGWAPIFAKPRHGYHEHAFHMQWTFCPVEFFTSFEMKSHVAFHARPEGDVRVRVTSAPPRREFIQRRVHSPIVSISLNKVRVTTHERPLIRIDLGERHHDRERVEVPIGLKYRRVTVRKEEPRQSVTVTHEEPARVIVQPAENRARVTVTPERSDNPRVHVRTQEDQPERKARVEVRSKHDDDQNNDRDDDNDRDKHRAKVEVHVR